MNELFIVFEGEIDKISAKELYNAISSADPEKHNKINLIFSSTGGNIYLGFFLANTIQNSKIPVRIHANNFIASIANIIYLSAKERTAEAFASFYLHGASDTVSGYKKDLEERVNLLAVNNVRIAHYIADNTRLSVDEVSKLMEDRSSKSAQEMLKYDIVKLMSHLEIPPNSDRIDIPYIITKKDTNA